MSEQNAVLMTNAEAIGRYRNELIAIGIEDHDELATLVRDAALHLLEDGLGVKGGDE